MDREMNIYKHNKPFQIQMNPIQPIQAKTTDHQQLNYENPKIATKFGFHYSPLHLQCLRFPFFPQNIHIEQESI